MEEGYEDKASADDVGIPVADAADEFFARIVFPSH